MRRLDTLRRMQPIEVAAEFQEQLVRLAPEFNYVPSERTLDPQTDYGRLLVAVFRYVLEWIGSRAIITDRGELWMADDRRWPDDVPG